MSREQEMLQHATAALGRGDLARAEQLCRELLAARPGIFEALYVLGIVAGSRGDPAQAQEWFARAVAADPRRADAHFNRGVAQGSLGRHDEAVASYERASALAPGNADAHYNRGVSLDALGRLDEALAAYDLAIAAQPAHAESHHNRGIVLARLGRAQESLAACDRAIALRPGYAAAHNHRGAMLAGMGRSAEALAAYDRAVSLRPAYAAAHNHRSIALHDLDRPADALTAAESALAVEPGLADAWYNRGNALRELARHAEAAESFERAIAIDPAHASAHWNLADCRLILGDFARGWKEYEWRWRLAARAPLRRDLQRPLWVGEEPVAGRTILLHAELGLGDTLQFCRYATLVAEAGARVVLEVQQPLVTFLGTLEGVDRVVARGEPLPAFDLHCPLMSLPLAFRTGAGGIPARIPYLRADPSRTKAWRERLGARTKPRVGLVWSGSTALRNDKRSMALVQALPMLVPGIDWISVQKEVTAADAALLATRADVRELGSGLADFADTAGLVDALDLVVTVDTSVAHVAGAIGKPAWILLPHNPHDWRWLLAREDSPWYPQARLFRQPAPGDWSSVVERVARELARTLAA